MSGRHQWLAERESRLADWDGRHLGGRNVKALPEVEILAGVENVGLRNGNVGSVEDNHNTPFFFISEVMSSTR